MSGPARVRWRLWCVSHDGLSELVVLRRRRLFCRRRCSAPGGQVGDVDRRLLPLHRTVFGVVVVTLVLGEVHEHLRGDAERAGSLERCTNGTLLLECIGQSWIALVPV